MDVADEFGATPLHLAAAGGLVGPLKALLETAADPSPLDKKGRTCLDLAYARQDERGGYSPQRKGRSPGLGSETDQCVKLLVEYGAPKGGGKKAPQLPARRLQRQPLPRQPP